MQTEETLKSRRFGTHRAPIEGSHGISDFRQELLELSSSHTEKGAVDSGASGIAADLDLPWTVRHLSHVDVNDEGGGYLTDASDLIKVIVTRPNGKTDIDVLSTSGNESGVFSFSNRKRRFTKNARTPRRRRVALRRTDLNASLQDLYSSDTHESHVNDLVYSDSEDLFGRPLSNDSTENKCFSEILSDRNGRQQKRQSDFNQLYIPSWLSPIDMTSRKTGNVLASDALGYPAGFMKPANSWNVNDSRRYEHSSRKNVKPVKEPGAGNQKATRKRHEDVEKEYMKLRSEMRPNEIHSDKIHQNTQSTARPVLGQPDRIVATDRQQDLFQSDTLGIYHFQKHIQNVKQNSKRHKRNLRHKDQGQRLNKGKQTSRFTPIYEGESRDT